MLKFILKYMFLSLKNNRVIPGRNLNSIPESIQYLTNLTIL